MPTGRTVKTKVGRLWRSGQCSYWRSYVGGITSLQVLVQVSGRNRVRNAGVSVAKTKLGLVLMLMMLPMLIRLKNSR